MVLNRLGLMPPRIGPDGYEVFVPPDAAYDLARAQAHIGRGSVSGDAGGEEPLAASERAALAMPALAWLDALLATVPAGTEKILLFPPIHAAAQPRPGSWAEAAEEECKARIAEIAREREASLLDFRRRSAVTMEDSNYWDPLHYRVGIAERLVGALGAARTGGAEPADGFYRLMTRSGPPGVSTRAP